MRRAKLIPAGVILAVSLIGGGVSAAFYLDDRYQHSSAAKAQKQDLCTRLDRMEGKIDDIYKILVRRRRR